MHYLMQNIETQDKHMVSTNDHNYPYKHFLRQIVFLFPRTHTETETKRGEVTHPRSQS